MKNFMGFWIILAIFISPSFAEFNGSLPNITLSAPDVLLSTNVGSPTSNQISITNIANVTAYNITLSKITGVSFLPNNFNLGNNETRIVNITFLASSIQDAVIRANITYYYKQVVGYIDPDTGNNLLHDEFIFEPHMLRTLDIRLKAKANPTTLAVSLAVSSFNITVGESKKGAVTISNTGGNSAFNISLKMDNTVFSPSVLSLNAGDTDVVGFNITIPFGKSQGSYTYQMRITSLNTDDKVVSVEVNVLGISGFGNGTNQSIIFLTPSSEQIAAFCVQFPETCFNAFCGEFPEECAKQTVKFIESPIDVSFTEQEVREKLFDKLDNLDDRINRIDNKYELLASNTNELKDSAEQIEQTTQESIRKQENDLSELARHDAQEKERAARDETVVSIGLGLILGGVIVLVIFKWLLKRR